MCKAWLAAACAACGILVCSGSAVTDWSAKSGAVTIPAGERWVADDADMAAVNALTSITFEDETSVLEFTGSGTTAPAVPVVGTGTVVKSGAGEWSYSGADQAYQKGFTGTFALSNGTITATHHSQVVAGESDTTAGTIYIDGGSLIVPNATLQAHPYQYEKLRLKGDGHNGQGALVINKGSTNGSQYRRIALVGDASVACNDYFWPRGFSLGGHVLTIGGTKAGTMIYYHTVSMSGPGKIRVARATPTSTSVREWSFRIASSSNLDFFPDRNPLIEMIMDPYTGFNAYVDEGKSGDTTPCGEFKKPITMDVLVNGGYVSYAHSHRYTHPKDSVYSTHTMTYDGRIRFADENSTICFGNVDSGANCQVKVDSYITGPGKVQVGNPTSPNVTGRILLANPTNDFAGTIAAGLQPYGSLALASPDVLPDCAKLSVNGGRVSLQVPAEDSPWTSNVVTRLANEATWTGDAILAFDSAETEGATNEFSLAGWDWNEKMTNANAILGVERGATLIVPGALTHTNRFAVAGGGTVRFTGGGRIDLGGDMLVGRALKNGMAGGEARFVFENATDIHSLTQALTVGSTDVSRMVFRNSKLVCDDPESLGATTCYSVLLGSASGEKGVFEMDADSVVSNRFQVGYANGSVGAVYQRGGTVLNRTGKYSEGQQKVYPTIGRSGYGYWEVSEGGHLSLQMRPIIGYSGPGLLVIDDGTVRIPQHDYSGSDPWLYMSWSGASTPGEVYIKKGTLNLASNKCYPIIGPSSGNWRAAITVDGPEALFDCNYTYHVGWSASGGGRFSINLLNGGVYRTVAVARRTSVTTRTNPDWVYVNFNGGTWRCRENGNPFPEYVSPTNNYLFAINVYENGATFDTSSYSPTISKPFRTAPGNGVQSIPMPDAVTSGTFVAPPVIVIDNAAGDTTGSGAMAQAIFDSKTGKVTSIRITARGFDYTQAPSAKFYMGNISDSCLIASVDCQIGENTSGSFTKKGTGTLTLSATNTWQGATVLAGGKLKLGVDNAIPATTTFVLAGGTLDMNGKTLGDGAVTEPTRFGVDVPTALANGAGEYKNYAFPDGATLAVTGADALPDFETARPVPLLKLTGTVPAALPEPAVVGTVAEGWTVRWVGGTLKACPARGTMLIVR